MSNKRKILGLLYVASLMGFSFVFVGNGCSNSFSTQSNVSDMSSFDAQQFDEVVDYVPGQKQVSVAYAKQSLDQMTTCLGVTVASDSTVRMYETKKGAISVYGSAETLTSPMAMALISVAGEVCNDLVNQEKAAGANARIFKNWNFSSNNLPAGGDLNLAINKIANSCWQRSENNEERAQILEMAASIVNGEEKASEKQAIAVCTGMLASLSGLLN